MGVASEVAIARFLELAQGSELYSPEAVNEAICDSREQRRKRDRSPMSSADEPGGRGAELLISWLSSFPLFSGENKAGYILFEGRLCNLDPRNRDLIEDLGLFYYDKTGKPLGKDAATATIGYLCALSRRDGAEIELFNRVGEKDGVFYYDLGNGRIVEFSIDGWRSIPSALFMRLFSHQQSQPDPLPGGDAWRLFDFIRVPVESRLLWLVTIVTCFIPRINHPLISIKGPQGSGKSFAQSLVKQIVDPSTVSLSLMPRKPEELPLVLSRNHMTALDNLSALSGEIADLICAVVTGGVLEKRGLYTDSEMVAMRVRGVITTSGITSFSDRPDLLERMVSLMLERISPHDRRTEKAIWKEFHSALPSILGGIFDIIVKAMAIHPGVEDSLLELPRMADFATWGFAAAEAMGGRGNEFLIDYTGNVSMATVDLLEHNTLFSSIVQAMERPGPGGLAGTFKEIICELTEIAAPNGAGLKMLEKDRSFPSAARSLRKHLERLRVPLEDMGITYVIDNHRTNKGRASVVFSKRMVDQEQQAAALDSLVFDDGELSS